MRALEAIERELDQEGPGDDAAAAAWMLQLAEETLEAWIAARGDEPTQDTREGFRLLALHHQGARATPSFNACRETCREIAWHFNLVACDAPDPARTLAMMRLLVRHLALFVGGKMQVAGLGEFCCASRPLRAEGAILAKE